MFLFIFFFSFFSPLPSFHPTLFLSHSHSLFLSILDLSEEEQSDRLDKCSVAGASSYTEALPTTFLKDVPSSIAVCISSSPIPSLPFYSSFSLPFSPISHPFLIHSLPSQADVPQEKFEEYMTQVSTIMKNVQKAQPSSIALFCCGCCGKKKLYVCYISLYLSHSPLTHTGATKDRSLSKRHFIRESLLRTR